MNTFNSPEYCLPREKQPTTLTKYEHMYTSGTAVNPNFNIHAWRVNLMCSEFAWPSNVDHTATFLQICGEL